MSLVPEDNWSSEAVSTLSVIQAFMGAQFVTVNSAFDTKTSTSAALGDTHATTTTLD